MNKRTYEFFGLIVLVLGLTMAGCGSDDKTDDSGDSAGTVKADATSDAEQDTGSAVVDSGSGTVEKDAGTTQPSKKIACGPALSCLLQCSSPTGTCADKCKTDLADGVEAKLKAFGDCRKKECAAAGNWTKEVNCAVEKCFDAMDACISFGQGIKGCSETAACLGGCVLGDLPCNVACLMEGAKGKAVEAKSYKACFDANCASKDVVEMAACATESCAAEIDTCVGAKKMDCSTLSACVAKCPVSIKSEVNHCDAYCRSFADGGAKTVWDTYVACKSQCLLVTNPVGCVIDKCAKEQGACYTDVGILNCQKVYDCVVAKCDGIGGDAKCIDQCRIQGSASAQDAYLHWEGCMLHNLKRDEAKTVKCAFPYDQATCLNYISNHFCGNKSAHCFTSN